jgi:hypothetical protein
MNTATVITPLEPPPIRQLKLTKVDRELGGAPDPKDIHRILHPNERSDDLNQPKHKIRYD